MLSMTGVFALSAAALLYIYVGYPAVLYVLVALRGRRGIRRADDLPSLTLIISAFNEAAVIAAKLRNALSLDYPADRLEIVVISDASDDGTDAIVETLAHRGVVLKRMPERMGKTAGLNRFVPESKGDIVVFSDANAMYERNALRMLVRNFADASVGCVTGEARYLTGDPTAAALSERAYWDYEILIKRLETAVGSMVGGDGAIYAIRKELWQSMPDNAINDFLNPLQIVSAGWRAVYEPDAICHEEPAGSVKREWRRRVRIVSRSWRAVFQARAVLNPFRVGLFTFCLLSHKVFRWLSGGFLVAAIVAAIAVVGQWLSVGAAAALALLVASAVVLVPSARRIGAFFVYWVTISVASLVGVFKGTFGRVSGVWTTPRGADAPETGRLYPGLGLGVLVLSIAAITFSAWDLMRHAGVHARHVFVGAVAILGYVYVGYPAILAAIRPMLRRPVQKADILPTVCLFIAANDEEAVIESKLRNSLDLDYPADRLSIVVASDGSIDRTNAIVRAYESGRLRLIEIPERRGKISAINEGMKQVRSDVVVFSDANTLLERGAVRALVRNLADSRVGAVSGDVVLVGDRAALALSEDLYYRYERWLQQAESEIGSMLGVDGALYAIRRDLFVPAPSDTILDDLAIPFAVIRQGRRVVFEPDAVARERGSESAAEEFSRKTRVVAGAVQFLLRRDSVVPLRDVQVLSALLSHKALRWLSPLFAAVAVAASLRLWAHPVFFAVAVLQGIVIAAGVLGCVPALRRWTLVGLMHYFLLVQLAAAVGLVRGALGVQSVAWRRFTRLPLHAS